MKKIIEYFVVFDDEIHIIQDEVNEKIQEGWQPYGSMTYSESNEEFYQPMVKYRE